jgi:DNA helicase-2/ATP-dependent DNA helicase PcrA
LVNENDSEALMRIINYPARGIGETTQNKLIVFADSQNVPITQVLDNLGFYAPQLGFK